MIRSIDRLLIIYGFEATELEQVNHRSALYLVIVIMSVIALTFFIMAALAWL